MLWTNTKRVIRGGFVNFWRNGFVSLASILVMTITLSVIGSIIFTSAILASTFTQIKDKVDINVYFVTDASESEIKAIESSLKTLDEVKEVVYTSREQVLADFKERHKNDEFTIQALDELSDNPLGAVINIKAKEPSQYEGITTFIRSKSVSQQDGQPIISKINFNDTKVKAAIENLSRITNAGQKLGFFLTIVLIVLSVIITFNTIRLTIYISREEISVMRLVGASSKFVRGPFVIIGIMYGIFAAVISMAIFYPLSLYLGTPSLNFTGINIFEYYIKNFGQIFLILLVAGVFIGAASSYLAVRRYLKV